MLLPQDRASISNALYIASFKGDEENVRELLKNVTAEDLCLNKEVSMGYLMMRGKRVRSSRLPFSLPVCICLVFYFVENTAFSIFYVYIVDWRNSAHGGILRRPC